MRKIILAAVLALVSIVVFIESGLIAAAPPIPPSILNGLQITALCNLFNGTSKGCVPSSPGGTTSFLRADGAWIAPPGGGGNPPGGTSGQIQYDNGGSFGGFTVGGDATLNTATGVLTVTKLGGVPVAPSATTDATNASNISSGTLGAARLPNPTASTLGGVESASPAAHQFMTGISTTGVPSQAQPAAGDVSGLAASATIDTTNASNISSGNLSLGRLPSIANNTALCNVSGASSTPIACSQAQLTSLINPFSSTLSGSVPASGGGTSAFLRADGSWASPPSGSGTPVVFVGASAGSANAYTLAAPTPGSFTLTDQFVVRTTIPATNTGPSTENVNATGATPIKKQAGANIVALAPGDLIGGQEADLTYNASCTCFLFMNPVGSAVSYISTATTVTSAQWANGQYFNATAALPLTLPISSTLSVNSGIEVFAQGGPLTVTPNAADAINGGTVGATATIPQGSAATITTDGAGNLSCTGCAVKSVASGGTGVSSFTAGLPVLGNGTSQLTQGTVTGNTTQFATSTGAKTSGDCASWDANGNVIDAGAACGSGGGASGTVNNSATADALAFYSATGTAVSPLSGVGTSGQVLTSNGPGVAPSFQPAPGASSGGPAFHPGFQPNLFYTLPTLNAIGTTTVTANRLYAVPFYNPNSSATTFTKESIYVSTGVTGSCELGIYNNNNGIPGTKIADSGTISLTTSTTGNQELAGLSLSVPSGWSWLAVGCNATPTIESTAPGSPYTDAPGLTGMINQNATSQSNVGGTWTFSAGGLPSNFPTVTYTGSTMPLVYVRL